MDNKIKEFWNKTNGFPSTRQLHKTIPSLTQNVLLNFLQQWYKKHEEPLSISGKNLCDLLCMTQNQLRIAKGHLEKNGHISVEAAGNPPKISYLLGREPEDLGKTPKKRRKVQNSAKTPAASLEKISDNILTTILNKKNILSEIMKIRKYELLYEKFGTNIELDLSCVLYEEIIRNRPDYFDWKLKNDKTAIAKIILSWCEDMDLLLRWDGRDPELVLDVILWCQQNSFWIQNIKSAEKLRKQFPRLHEQMDDDNGKKSAVCQIRNMYPELTEQLIQLYRKNFLSGRKNDWSIKDKEKFIKAAKLLVKFAQDGNLIQSNVPGYLIRCLYVNYTEEEKAVLPGHLCSDRTWNILMPQYLTEFGVTYAS